jgi:hypothetical protein
MADLKNSRAQSRLEKAAREGGNTWVGYEAEAKAVREKTARLKALRLAKEAADKSAAAVDESTAARKPATKRALKSSGAPPMSADRSKDGRRDWRPSNHRVIQRVKRQGEKTDARQRMAAQANDASYNGAARQWRSLQKECDKPGQPWAGAQETKICSAAWTERRSVGAATHHPRRIMKWQRKKGPRQ